HWSACKMSSR
ncbi:parB/RepB/Spo0J family partition domain protein, partial [Vibrio parahaemolyticus V-223/04]